MNIPSHIRLQVQSFPQTVRENSRANNHHHGLKIQHVNFSTTQNVVPNETEGSSESPTPTIQVITKAPSILTTLPENFTCGQGWSALQINLAGKKSVRLNDFSEICRAARPSCPKDAAVIRTALKDLKRCNHFTITTEVAEISLNAMRRALLKEGEGLETPTGSPEHLVKCGVFVGDAFTDVSSGLYVAAEAEVVYNVVLKTLLEGVEGLQGLEAADTDESDSDSEGEDEESLLAVAANSAKHTIDSLLLRSSNPTRDMKKRKKRSYLMKLRCSSGPTPQMIDTAVQICLKHDDSEKGVAMAKDILEAYKERAYLGTTLKDTATLLSDKEAELAKAAAAEAEEEESAESEDGDDADKK